MIKVFIILYIVVVALMLLMIPIKLLTTEQVTCPRCTNKTMFSKRSKNHDCPHCGSAILRDGNLIFPGQTGST